MAYFLSFEFWLIIILLALNVILGYYLYLFWIRDRKTGGDSYTQALELIVDGKLRLAVDKLKETVRTNSTNIKAYIKLVTILRAEGLYTNAIRILKDLAIRANLKQDDIILVKKNIALTYWEAGEFDKAEAYFDELISIKSQVSWVVPYLLKILERKKDWTRAYELLKDNLPEADARYKYKLSVYKLMDGKATAESGQEKEARIMYKEALKIDSNNSGAYLLLGDSYLREERVPDAIKIWTDFCQKLPDKAYLVLGRIQKALYETGQYSKIEKIYEDLLQNNENNLKIIIALSEIYRKKGEYDEAYKLLQEAQKRDIDPIVVDAQIAKVLNDKGQQNEALKKAISILDKKILSSMQQYRCTHCSYESPELHWICPKCGEWQLNI